jgi:hypothetical protein
MIFELALLRYLISQCRLADFFYVIPLNFLKASYSSVDLSFFRCRLYRSPSVK